MLISMFCICLSFICGTVLCADGGYSVSLSKVTEIVLQGTVYHHYACGMRDSFSCFVFAFYFLLTIFKICIGSAVL